MEIPLLSLALTVNVTVCDCDEVLRSTDVSFALKLLIIGLWSSLFLTTMLIVEVAVLPTPSVAVAVNVSVESPNEKLA